MKKLIIGAIISAMACINPAIAQNYSLQLTNPDKQAKLEVSVMNGSVTVQGYEGKTIEITTSSDDMTPIRNEESESQEEDDYDIDSDNDGDSKSRSTSGLKKVKNSAVQIQIEERNNHVEIGSHTRRSKVNLTIKVPFNAKLEIGVHKGGDIRVSDVTGPMELGNSRGGIFAENVSGPIVAESHRKDIEVVFATLNQSEPSTLTSHRGSIDITVPQALKGDVQVHTYKGEIYSGLDTEFVADKKVNHKKKGSGQEITIGGLMSAELNGGGQSLTLTTYRGDIYVRKK